MSYLPLARKYRPKTFSEVFGQTVSKRILANSVILNRIPNGMLISGMRGTGKTTLARIYAMSINCTDRQPSGDPCCACKSCIEALNGTHPDIIEFDAASNNGVDFIRDLSELVSNVPGYAKKVIIFDEAHMFTPQAQSAFLKMLEEPVEGTVYILVTTDPDRIIDTVRSRCLSMPLKPLTNSEVEESIKKILTLEGKSCTVDFIKSLSLLSDGSLRDIQQILDQCISASGEEILTESYLEDAVGIISSSQYKSMAYVLNSLDLSICFQNLMEWDKKGYNLELMFIKGLPVLLRDFMINLKGINTVQLMTGIPREVFEKNMRLTAEYVKFISGCWDEFYPIMKDALYPRVIWEMFFVKVCQVD
jgi:DNA polymerase-3 subunit gamma/tau